MDQYRCDVTKSTIYIAHDPLYHDRIKHVDINWFYVKGEVEEKTTYIGYLPLGEQCADILTKGLLDKIFTRLVS